MCVRRSSGHATRRDASAISMSLFLIVMVSVLLGSGLPFGFARAGVDPAHAGTTIQVKMELLAAVRCPFSHWKLEEQRAARAPTSVLCAGRGLLLFQQWHAVAVPGIIGSPPWGSSPPVPCTTCQHDGLLRLPFQTFRCPLGCGCSRCCCLQTPRLCTLSRRCVVNMSQCRRIPQ